MKKSIVSCVLGIILSIIGAIVSYLFWVISVLVSIGTNSFIAAIGTTLPLLNLGAFALALIGSIVCAFKLKVGSILMLIGSIISLVCYAVLLIALNAITAGSIFLILPTLLLLVISIKGISKAKHQN